MFGILTDHYGRSRSSNASDQQQHILDCNREREASFSSALLDGLVALKEASEDRLVWTVEIDFDWVKKQKPGQTVTHQDLVPAITCRLPQLLRIFLQVERSFTDLQKGLAKAMVLWTNERAARRSFGPELSRKVCTLNYRLF